MAEKEAITKYEPPAPELPNTQQAGACDMIVHGLDGSTPGTTVAAMIYLTPRDDGRTIVQIAPLAPQNRRRFGSWRFIVEGKTLQMQESRR
jgi:hypothetical protein